MEHNYENLHLDGSLADQRKMVHNQIPIKHSWVSTIGNLVNAFIVLAIGTTVLSAVSNNLRKQGLM